MTGQKDLYASISQLFRWEENRKSKITCLLFGIYTGVVITGLSIGSLIRIAAEFNVQTIALCLGVLVITALIMLATLAWFFGWRNLKSLIKIRHFKLGLIVGICSMSGLIIAAFIMMIINPISINIGPW